jgi:nitroreductase
LNPYPFSLIQGNFMTFFSLIQSRRSIRLFKDSPVEMEKLQKILEACNLAPSAGNLQGYEIYVVTEPEQRQALVMAALGQAFLAQAPVDLVFCANPQRSAVKYGKRGRELYSVQDATIACTFAMLAAQQLGLSSVWVGAFQDEPVRQAARLPADLLPVALLPLGYAAEDPKPRPRRKLDDLVHR